MTTGLSCDLEEIKNLSPETIFHSILIHLFSTEIKEVQLTKYILDATHPYGPNKLLYLIPQLKYIDITSVVASFLADTVLHFYFITFKNRKYL